MHFVAKLVLGTATMIFLGSTIWPSPASAFKWSRTCNINYNKCTQGCTGGVVGGIGACRSKCDDWLLNCEATGNTKQTFLSTPADRPGKPKVPGVGQVPPPPKSNPTTSTKPQGPQQATAPKSNSNSGPRGPGLR